MNENKTHSELFDICSPRLQPSPYSFYDHYRVHDPVHRGKIALPGHKSIDWWYIFRYNDAENVLKDHHRFSSNHGRLSESPSVSAPGAFWRIYKRGMKVNDPPEHTRLRKPILQFFSPQFIDLMIPRFRQLANDLIDDFIAKGKVELVADFSYPYVLIIILETLGIPIKDMPRIHQWLHTISPIMEFRMWGDFEIVDHATSEFETYFKDLCSDLKDAPNKSVIGHLFGPLGYNTTEIASICIPLMLAGREATAIAINNCIFALLDYPEQLQLLKNNPELIRSAVRESLRFHTPLQGIARIALEDTIISGKTIRQGESVTILLGACNRDPEIFTHPDTFDITRRNRNLALGTGIHHCLGAYLGEITMIIAVETLLSRLPSLKLETAQSTWTGPALRGPQTLPLKF